MTIVKYIFIIHISIELDSFNICKYDFVVGFQLLYVSLKILVS